MPLNPVTHQVEFLPDPAQIGRWIAHAGSDEQAGIFLVWAECARQFPWSFQCSHIADELKKEGRTERVVWMLRELLDHLEES